MSQFAIQHVRFFRPSTKPVHCMAYDTYSNRLALSRSDGFLEIYLYRPNGVRFTFDVCLPSFLTKDDSPTSIEALAWYNGRLFSAGLGGFVYEYDFDRLAIARSLALDSSSIWALTATTSSQSGGGLLACAADSGNIYLVNLLAVDCNVTTEHTLGLSGPPLLHRSGRVLSLAWVSTDKYLVSGGMESIYVWRIAGSRRGQISWQMSLPKDVIVWSLVAYPAPQPLFASSDSRGIVSIWDVKHGTLISELSTHHLDVLTLSVGMVGSSGSPTIFASGADPTVVSVLPVSQESLTNVDSWMTAEIHKEHDRDVRASCFIAPDLLLTAGMDRSIVVSRINFIRNRKVAERATMLNRIMPVSNWVNLVSVERISSSQSVMAFSQSSEDGNHVEIWQLLATPQDYENEDEPNQRGEHKEPVRQLVIRMPCHLPPQIVKLSPLANFLAFAAGSVMRVFKLDIRAPSASKHFVMNFEPSRKKYPAPMVTAIAYCNEPSKAPVLALSADGQLTVRSLWHPNLTQTFCLGEAFNSTNSGTGSTALPTLFLRVSSDENENSFCVAVGSRTLIYLYQLSVADGEEDVFSLEATCRVPSYNNGFITALSLYPSRLLILAFSDRRVAEFDGNAQRYTKWTRQTLVGASTKSLKSKAKRQKMDNEQQQEKADGNDVANAYPHLWLMQQETIDWVGYATAAGTKILTASSRLLATIDKTAPLPMRIEGPLFQSKLHLQHRRPNSPGDHKLAIQHKSRFRYILAFDCLKQLDETKNKDLQDETEPGELFVAELPSGEFLAQLPPMVVSKKQFAA